MNSYKFYRGGLALALAAAVSLTQSVHSQNAVAPAAVPTTTQQAALAAMDQALAAAVTAAADARQAWVTATFAAPANSADVQTKLTALRDAELALANARATEFNKIQSTTDRFSAEQIPTLVTQATQGGRGGGRGGRGGNFVIGQTWSNAWAVQQSLAAAGRLPLNVSQIAVVAAGSETQAATNARAAYFTAVFASPSNPRDVQSKLDALARAELALAKARADAFVKLQQTANKANPSQVQLLVNLGVQGGNGGRGGGGGVGSDYEGQVLAGADFSPKEPIKIQTPAEEAKGMILQPGFRLTPILSDPYIQEPVQIAFDGNGRLFVDEMRSYMQDPQDNSANQPISRISMHEDLNGDGLYDERDRHTVFADGLVAPRWIIPIGMNSVAVQEYNRMGSRLFTDTNGDGVADKEEVFFAGTGQIGGNIEHQNSGLTWGLDNWMYANLSNFRLRWTPTGIIQETSSGILGGQWGVSMDDYGNMYSQGGASGVPATYNLLPLRYGVSRASLAPGFGTLWGAPMIGEIQGGMGQIVLAENRLASATAGAGADIFRGHRLPKDMIGNYFYGEPVGRIVRRIRVENNGGMITLRNVYNQDEFIKGTDPLFRPVDMTTAPDGTMYITDMYRGIIQEAQWTGMGTYNRAKIEQYSMDRVIAHGRIFRLTHDSMARDTTKPNMGNEKAAELVAHLAHPNGWWRDTAQQLLVIKQDKSVVPDLQKLARTSTQLGRIHALWTLEGLGALDATLVREALKSTDAKVRIQAAQLSEGLIKAGDTSLIADVKELAKATDPDVVIQAMLTVGYVKAPDAVAFIQSTVAANQAAGVTTIGGTLAANGGLGVGGGGRGGRGGGGARGGAGGAAAAPAAPAAPAAAAPAE